MKLLERSLNELVCWKLTSSFHGWKLVTLMEDLEGREDVFVCVYVEMDEKRARFQEGV